MYADNIEQGLQVVLILIILEVLYEFFPIKTRLRPSYKVLILIILEVLYERRNLLLSKIRYSVLILIILEVLYEIKNLYFNGFK